ncbi:MAG: hypothetical protein F6K09_39005, partial [Merismopedia sp. SIO2A8]|nr:hypothetical protein [Merismopedia sp. SIO2A8]
LEDRAINDPDWGARSSSVQVISEKCGSYKNLDKLLIKVIKRDPFVREGKWQDNPRKTALENFSERYPDSIETFNLLNDRATKDPEPQLREWAQKKIEALNREDE